MEPTKDTQTAPHTGGDVFVFDVSPDTVDGRARRLRIEVPEHAQDGVGLQLRALSAHAETAGLSLPKDQDA